MKIRTVKVSNSALAAVQSCSTVAGIKQALRYQSKEEGKRLKAGKAIHLALAEHFRGKKALQCAKVFAEDYAEWAEEHVEPDDAYSYENIDKILCYWLTRHPLQAFPFTVKPEHVEISFSLPLLHRDRCLCMHKRERHSSKGCSACDCDRFTQVQMRGIMDLLTEYDGQYIPLDHKTTGAIRPDWLAKFQLDSQMSDYVWVAGKQVGEAVDRFFVNAIELKNVPSSDRKCPEHKVEYAECGIQHVQFKLVGPQLRTKEQLRQWRRTALHLTRRLLVLRQQVKGIEDLLELPQEGTFGGDCQYCDCREFCLAGRPLKQFGHMFGKSEGRFGDGA